MADKKDKDEKDEKTVKTEGGGLLDNKLVLLGIIVVLQAIMAIVIVQFVIAPKLAGVAGQVEQQVATEAAAPTDGVIVSLNELVVSLEGGGKGGYLKITIDLEVIDQATADIVIQKLPKLRHIAIMSLTTKTVADLRSHSGKAALDAELLRKFGDTLPKGALTSVFFSDLVIQ